MNHPEALAILVEYNAWRRGDETHEQLPPKLIGEAIDVAISALKGDVS